MIKMLLARLQQGYRTIPFPDGPPPALSDRFRGRPGIDESKCNPKQCQECADACPTGAIDFKGKIKIDLGKCLFCADCLTACPKEAITCEQDYRLAVRQRQDLIVEQGETLKLAAELDAKVRKLFGRSLALRKTYDATPKPKLVIAVGACAISGGPYIDHGEVANGADSMLPVDLYIPGCPPHPLTILDGILRLLGRIRTDQSHD